MVYSTLTFNFAVCKVAMFIGEWLLIGEVICMC